MRYWLREVAGWLLVGLGLFFFLLTYGFCERHEIFEAWPIAVIGIFVFRGGIHLLKVAIAARICQQAQDRLYPEAPPATLGTRPAPARDRPTPESTISRASRGS
jgi:hypothetical protein